DRISGFDAYEKAAHYARASQRNNQAQAQPNSNNAESLPQDHFQNVAWRGSHCHANPNFLGALSCGVGDNAIDTYDSENQAEKSHGRRQLCAKAEEEKSIGALKGLGHGLHLGDGNVSCQIVDLTLDLERQCFWRDGSTNMDSAHGHVGLLERNIEKRLRVFGDVLIFGVLHDSYNLDERTFRAFDAEAFAEGVFLEPKLLGHRLIDDGNKESFFAVGIGELPSAQQRHLDGVEISRSHNVVANVGRLLAGFERTVFKGKRITG